MMKEKLSSIRESVFRFTVTVGSENSQMLFRIKHKFSEFLKHTTDFLDSAYFFCYHCPNCGTLRFMLIVPGQKEPTLYACCERRID